MIILMLVAVLATSSAASSVAESAGDLWISRFASEAPAAWEKARDRARRLSIEGTITITSKAGVVKEGWRCLRDGDLFAFERSGDHGSGFLAGGRTEEYGFKLKRASAEASWMLSGFGSHEEALSYPLATAQQAGLYGLVEDQWSIMSVPLSEIVSHETFTIGGAREIDNGPNRLVEIAYDLEMEVVRGSNHVSLGGGTIRFDPHTWVVVSYDVRERTIGRLRGEIEYDGQTPGHMESVRLEIEWQDGSLRATDATFSRYEYGAIPRNEFGLSAFGVATPAPPPVATLDWIGWAIGVGVLGSLFLGFARHLDHGLTRSR